MVAASAARSKATTRPHVRCGLQCACPEAAIVRSAFMTTETYADAVCGPTDSCRAARILPPRSTGISQHGVTKLQAKMQAEHSDRWSKVPRVTLTFWLIKIVATTPGETGGDWVTMSLNLGTWLAPRSLQSCLSCWWRPRPGHRGSIRHCIGRRSWEQRPSGPRSPTLRIAP
jgi:hypothetical protein